MKPIQKSLRNGNHKKTFDFPQRRLIHVDGKRTLIIDGIASVIHLGTHRRV